MDAVTKADLKFDILCPRGLRVRVRPVDQVTPWLVQQPDLRTQLDLLDPKTAYAVDMVYAVSDSVIMIRLYSFATRWFNAFLFEEATHP